MTTAQRIDYIVGQYDALNEMIRLLRLKKEHGTALTPKTYEAIKLRIGQFEVEMKKSAKFQLYFGILINEIDILATTLRPLNMTQN